MRVRGFRLLALVGAIALAGCARNDSAGSGAEGPVGTVRAALAPSVTGIAPTSAAAGTPVVITGQGFTGTTAVLFGDHSAGSFVNGISAVYAVNSDTQLAVTVPQGSLSGPIHIVTPGGEVWTGSFTALSSGAPVITSFSPSPIGAPGNVDLVGSGFTGTTAVSIGGTAAAFFQTTTDGALTIGVAAGTASGTVKVQNGSGSVISSGTLVVLPVPQVTSFLPASGQVGDTVVITGTGFVSASEVRFGISASANPNGGLSASFTPTSATSISATVPAGAVSGAIRVVTGGGTGDSASPFSVQSGALPTISGFNPTSAGVGQSVHLTGTGFTGLTGVSFHGTPSGSAFPVSDTDLDATVPPGATSGTITVTNTQGQVTSVASLTVPPPPAIVTMSPTTGAPGTQVTLTGSGFTGTSQVTLGNVAAAFTVVSDTQLHVTVPTGTSIGPFNVVAPGGGAYSQQAFTVLGAVAPTISSFSPPQGGPGLQVTVHGTGFTGTTSVSFNGAGNYGFSVVSDTVLNAMVAVGATTGPISVTNNLGTAVSAASFLVVPPPTVTGFSPGSGIIGDAIAITGAGFTDVTLVQFGGQGAVFTILDDSHITALVPAGAKTGPLQVGGALTGSSFTVLSAAAPTITGFSPASGGIGTYVTLDGQNFTGTTGVSFNGLPSGTFSIMGDTSLGTYVPGGATTGPITVTNTQGQATSTGSFVVLLPPTIQNFGPQSGAAGTVVTINGSGLTGTNQVNFGPATAAFTVVSDTVLHATVPVGAGSGFILVNTSHGSANSSSNFDVLSTVAPTITGFAPTSGGPGKLIVVTGTGFTGATGVKFNGTPSFGWNFIDDTKLQANVPLGASSGTISVTNTLGTAVSAATFTVPSPPSVTGFSPNSGKVGDPVVITGSGFSSVSLVQFNNDMATFTVDSDTQITALVPSGSTSGPVDVGGTKTAQSFTVLSGAAPTITGLSPASGPPGTIVIIDGQNFTGTTGVSFNGTSAPSFFLQSDGQINVTVPNGATTGKVSVTNTQGTAPSSGSFTVVSPPTLTSFAPTTGSPGDSIVLTGTGFLGVSSVSFQGANAGSYTIDSSTQITVVVPGTAATGPISLNNNKITSVGIFTVVSNVAPTISSFSPASGGISTQVKLTGTGFGGATEVDFGGIPAVFSASSDTSLTATVPLGAATGKITVKNAAGSGQSAGSFTLLAAPTITSFTPTSGSAGATVQVTGSGFTGTTGVSIGSVGGVQIKTFSVVDDAHLSFVVPVGATTGTFSISAPGGTVVSSANFGVVATAPPTLTGMSPATGGVGTAVQLTGTGFTGTTQVTFGGVASTIMGGKDDSSFTALVPAGAVTGPIVLTNALGSAQSSKNFVVDHSMDVTITSVSPDAGKPGTVVTITGTNLAGGMVGFSPGFSQATITSSTATTIVVTVPLDSTTGFVFVQVQTSTFRALAGYPFTVYTPACTGLLAGSPCGLCEVCNASGGCAVAAADDNACGLIACSANSGVCGTFADLTAGRCKAAGACKTASPSDCVATTSVAAGTTCGVCSRCDGSGACVADLTQNTDCPACQVCAALGACAPEPSGSDVKAECPALPCHTGACNGAGACGVNADGTGCDDVNRCTQTDACLAGACVGANFVVCAASDACHDVGSCDPTSGNCSNPVLANGTPCDDGLACTTGDACQSGACTAGLDTCPCRVDADCIPRDQCHVQGQCSPSTRTCSNPTAANGATCDDGDACTRTDTCVAGVCTGASAVVCAAQDQCHDVGQCDSGTGQCSNPAKADGTTCDDGVACHLADSCQAGSCVFGSNACRCTTNAECVPSDQCHVAGTCDPTTHLCTDPIAPNGTSCSDANACTSGETCQSGVCGSPTGAIACAPAAACRDAGVCNPATGSCAYATAADGTACTGGTCRSGACIPAPDAGAPDAGAANGGAGGTGMVADAAPGDGAGATSGAGGRTTGSGGNSGGGGVTASGGATSSAGASSGGASSGGASNGGATSGGSGGSEVDAAVPPVLSAGHNPAGCGCRTETSGHGPGAPWVLGFALGALLLARRRDHVVQ